MNIGTAFLLVLGVVLLFGTVTLHGRTRGGWLYFVTLYGLAVALLLAGFGVYTIDGING